MLLGRVTGTVVASRKEPLMEGWKLLVVRQLDAENQRGRRLRRRGRRGRAPASARSSSYATGSSARKTETTRDRPCDAVIMAIVDTWEVGGTEVYRK